VSRIHWFHSTASRSEDTSHVNTLPVNARLLLAPGDCEGLPSLNPKSPSQPLLRDRLSDLPDPLLNLNASEASQRLQLPSCLRPFLAFSALADVAGVVSDCRSGISALHTCHPPGRRETVRSKGRLHTQCGRAPTSSASRCRRATTSSSALMSTMSSKYCTMLLLAL